MLYYIYIDHDRAASCKLHPQSMQGRRPSSFIPTKKKPAPVGDEDGQMKPSSKASRMYSSITFSGQEHKQLTMGGCAAWEQNDIAIKFPVGWQNLGLFTPEVFSKRGPTSL